MPYRKLDAAIQVVADSLAVPEDLDGALARIVTAARDNIAGTDYASITIRHQDGTLETAASTDPIAVAVDEMQYTLHEGPCYDVAIAETVTYANDLAVDPDWPRYGPRAAELGMRSQFAVRLADGRGTATGLNLYSRSLKAFEETEGMPELFASHARIALGYATELQSLKGAIGTREKIGQAIGILRERYKVSPDRAFDYLVRLSQNSNTKLRDIASTIVNIDPNGPPATDHADTSTTRS